MKDFTLTSYRGLLQSIIDAGYSFFTFEDWCDGKATGNVVILRHDVDLKAENSLAIARIEAEMGICSTYYFRVVPQSNKPEIILSIAELGHEIGYHYEDMAICQGDAAKAKEHFILQLEYFRNFYPVRTICMHGSPTSKWDNRELWKNIDYSDFGVIGEPYIDFLSKASENSQGMSYFTDTARMWNGERYNLRDKSPVQKQSDPDMEPQGINSATDCSEFQKIHTTFDLIGWFNTMPTKNGIMITTHPQRWTDHSMAWIMELVKQSVKNRIKKYMVKRLKEIDKDCPQITQINTDYF